MSLSDNFFVSYTDVYVSYRCSCIIDLACQMAFTFLSYKSQDTKMTDTYTSKILFIFSFAPAEVKKNVTLSPSCFILNSSLHFKKETLGTYQMPLAIIESECTTVQMLLKLLLTQRFSCVGVHVTGKIQMNNYPGRQCKRSFVDKTLLVSLALHKDAKKSLSEK